MSESSAAAQHNGFHAEIPFLMHLGAQCVLARDGQAEIRLTLQPWQLNSWGVAHGGLVMTLLDVALAQAGRSLDAQAVASVTVDLKTSFLQPAHGPELRALGRCRHRSTTLSFCEGELLDGEGRLIAQALGTFKYLHRRPQREASA